MTETLETPVVEDQGPEIGSKLGKKLAGKYMAFRLANEVYALELLKVREIIGMMEITRVARTAEHIRGVINLRGKVIPVMDQKLKFGMERTEATDQTVIIVVQLSSVDLELTIGILVDEVQEVLSIEADEIEPPPDFGSGGVNANFILGVAKHELGVIFLLDIEKVLSGEKAPEVNEDSSKTHG